MGLYWQLAMQSLAGGVVLLLAATLSRAYEKTVFAPATAMLLTWAVALVILSFLPLIGFDHLSAEAVRLYVLGAGWFALVSLFTSWMLQRHGEESDSRQYGVLERLNYPRLMVLWTASALFVYPMAVVNIISYGLDIVEISYTIRRESVAGESILHPALDNAFLVIGVFANIALLGVVRKSLKPYAFLVLVAPFIVITLIVSGRSGLVSLMLGWMAIVAIFSKRLKLRYFLLPAAFLLFVVYFGGVWVKKFDVEGQSLVGAVGVLADHVFDYLYQGPVLFSRYLAGEINVAANWDFLNSACHILSKLDLCSPVRIHAEFAQYGDARVGNVYSMYFSILPNYGAFGLVVVFLVYSVFITFLFSEFKKPTLFAVSTYPFMFSAIFLSVYKDSVGYSLYWLLKVFIVCSVLGFFLVDRSAGVDANRDFSGGN